MSDPLRVLIIEDSALNGQTAYTPADKDAFETCEAHSFVKKTVTACSKV